MDQGLGIGVKLQETSQFLVFGLEVRSVEFRAREDIEERERKQEDPTGQSKEQAKSLLRAIQLTLTRD